LAPLRLEILNAEAENLDEDWIGVVAHDLNGVDVYLYEF
jgi:hypothetical protein